MIKNFKILFFLSLILSFHSYSQLDETKKKEFGQLVRKADLLFSQNDFLESKKVYELALAIDPSDAYAIKQRDKCIANEKVKGKSYESSAYQKIISKADEKFTEAKYAEAKKLFERALDLKPGDEYPISRLKQIDDLLNPKSTKKAEPLPVLGEVSDLSISEAEKALKEADLQRKNKKISSVLDKDKAVSENENDLVANKNKEMLNSSQSMIQFEKSIDAQAKSNQEEKDSLNAKLQLKTKEFNTNSERLTTELIDKNYLTDKSLEKNKLLRDSATVESKEIGNTNDVFLQKERKSSGDSLFTFIQNKEAQRNDNQKDLSASNLNVEQKAQDNSESRKVVVTLANETAKKILTNDVELAEKRYTSSTDAMEEVAAIKLDNEKLISKGYDQAGVSSNELKEKTKIIASKSDSIHATPQQKIIEHKDKIAILEGDQQDSISEVIKEAKNNLTVQLQSVQRTILSNDQTMNEKIVDQRNESQTELADKNISTSSKVEESKEKQANTLKDFKEAEDKSYIDAYMFQQKEIQEKLDSKDRINSLETKVIIGSSENNMKSPENASTINNLEHSLMGSQFMDQEVQNNKRLESRSYVESIEKKTIVFDAKVANELGSLYEEGVTQETFNTKDDSGLVTATITRRIVVKSGYGQVYTRTQTLNSITYSKNGSPSTEFVWQRETQDAKLKKN